MEGAIEQLHNANDELQQADGAMHKTKYLLKAEGGIKLRYKDCEASYKDILPDLDD